jgi:acyl-coenzyme A thioesterase PaaI-like protein
MVSAQTDIASREAARDAAASLRRLTESVAAADIPLAELKELGADLRGLADRLGRYPALDSTSVPGSNPFDTTKWERHCVLGESNAIAPPVRITANHEPGQEVVVGECTLTEASETPVGMVHGAPIAGILMSIVGLASEFSGKRTYVGTASIRFEKPIPLANPLRFEGRPLRQEGRKVFVEAKVFSGDDLVVTCEAVNIIGRDS